jgi:hypothetical protein
MGDLSSVIPVGLGFSSGELSGVRSFALYNDSYGDPLIYLPNADSTQPGSITIFEINLSSFSYSDSISFPEAANITDMEVIDDTLAVLVSYGYPDHCFRVYFYDLARNNRLIRKSPLYQGADTSAGGSYSIVGYDQTGVFVYSSKYAGPGTPIDEQNFHITWGPGKDSVAGNSLEDDLAPLETGQGNLVIKADFSWAVPWYSNGADGNPSTHEDNTPYYLRAALYPADAVLTIDENKAPYAFWNREAVWEETKPLDGREDTGSTPASWTRLFAPTEALLPDNYKVIVELLAPLSDGGYTKAVDLNNSWGPKYYCSIISPSGGGLPVGFDTNMEDPADRPCIIQKLTVNGGITSGF